MTSMIDIDLSFKIILVGDSGVGKTNILTRYTKNIFNYENKATIGVEFGTKILNVQDHVIKLQIWDTAGQERYKSITVAYYKGSKGAFIVYDVTKKHSFENVKKWYNDIRKNGEKDLSIILIGNKTDLKDREISFDEAARFAEMYNIGYLETSALNTINIDYAFTLLTQNIFEEMSKNYRDSEEYKLEIKEGKSLAFSQSFEVDDKKPQQNKLCC